MPHPAMSDLFGNVIDSPESYESKPKMARTPHDQATYGMSGKPPIPFPGQQQPHTSRKHSTKMKATTEWAHCAELATPSSRK